MDEINSNIASSESMPVKIIRRYVLPLVSIALMILLDQWTKYLTLMYVKDTDGFYIINKILRIYFVRNEGMAWGMLQNKQVLFIILTPIIVAALMYFYYRMPFEKKYILARSCILLLTGGAIGNLIDRIFRGENLFHGYVVDMIYVEIINFPVFNIADSFISIGFVLLIVSIIFVYKEKDFDIVFGIKRKNKEEITESASDSNKDEVTGDVKEVTSEMENNLLKNEDCED